MLRDSCLCGMYEIFKKCKSFPIENHAETVFSDIKKSVTRYKGTFVYSVPKYKKNNNNNKYF